ncbi:MAG: NlpC/P60 family protein [Dokdonella sp.]
MTFKRMMSLFLLVFLAFPAFAAEIDSHDAPAAGAIWQLNLDPPLATLDTVSVPNAVPGDASAAPPVAAAEAALADSAVVASARVKAVAPGTHLRKLLADFAVTLRDIRYRRGGDSPSTGFDCSGFVRYVFQHSIGQQLPMNSASQYRIGSAIARSDLEVGDLVFFHIRGKRVSHVGIYLGHGHFIHSPSTGRTVSISSLDDAYWAKHFAGAKRPNVLS